MWCENTINDIFEYACPIGGGSEVFAALPSGGTARITDTCLGKKALT